MTITYSLNVSEARLCGFAKLLLRWRGSIYKLLYREMIIFCCLYFGLSALYRHILNDHQKAVFESLAKYCEKFTDLIPLSFVLGFYVSIVVGRWWQQYMNVPWPDKAVMAIAAYVNGTDERGRVIRRTMARYLSLLSALTFQAISTAVKKRFPTLDHMEEAGLMTKEERRVYDSIPVSHGKWWVPAQWFVALAVRARKEGRIKDDILLKHLLQEMHEFRGCCGMLYSYDWISIPLVYTQVVTLAIYTYFLATVMGRQYLSSSSGDEIDLYIPVFTILQFFFYMGWLKVAEQLINPFGEDDDDFELNWCLDRNLQVSFQIVDDMHQRHPRLVRDIYWDEAEPQLPYTKSSVNLRTQPHLGSAMTLDVDPEESEFVPMETILEEDHDEHKYSSPPTSPPNAADLPQVPGPLGSHFYHVPLHLQPSECAPPSTISNHLLDSPLISTRNTSDNTTQTGLRILSTGSRLLNLIIGSSNDNLPQSPKIKEHPLVPHFVSRPQGSRRTARTVSLCEGLDHRSHEFAVEERRSLLRGDDRPTIKESVPTSVIVDLAAPPTTIEESKQTDESQHDKRMEEQPEQSPYEPNSSTESLVENSQCSTDSYTQLLPP
uniref:Bestrophin homolog n=1 Tax=Rhipicephalus appendiculatus TaxID=34631 RepID=A0A131YUG2_RHIAP